MSRSLLAVETPLDRHRPILVDGELPFAVGASIDRVVHLALTALIGIGGFERFQAVPDASVFRHGRLDIRFLELRLVIVYVAQLHNHPRVGNVIFVVVVVLPLGEKKEKEGRYNLDGKKNLEGNWKGGSTLPCRSPVS